MREREREKAESVREGKQWSVRERERELETRMNYEIKKIYFLFPFLFSSEDRPLPSLASTSPIVKIVEKKNTICHMLAYFTIQAKKRPLSGLLFLKKIAILLLYHCKFTMVLW